MPLDRVIWPLRTLRRCVLARRRPLAALCAAVAVVAGVRAATAPLPPEVPVLTAARDLPAGSVLAADDLVEVGYAADTPPSGTLSAGEVLGEVLAAPLRAGEPVTDVRLVGAGLAAIDPGLVAVPVRLPDAATVALLEAGDRVDLVATDPEGRGSRVLLGGAPVLAVPPEASGSATSQPGGLVVLGVPPEAVPDVADAGVRYFLSYAFSGEDRP